jgi:hypothetical protein
MQNSEQRVKTSNRPSWPRLISWLKIPLGENADLSYIMTFSAAPRRGSVSSNDKGMSQWT